MHASFMKWPGALDARFRGAGDDPPPFRGQPTSSSVSRSLLPPSEGRLAYRQNVEPAAQADDDEQPADPRDPEHVWTCAGLIELLRTSVAEGDLPEPVFNKVRQLLIQLPNKLAAKKSASGAQASGQGRPRERGELLEENAEGMHVPVEKVAQDAARRLLDKLPEMRVHYFGTQPPPPPTRAMSAAALAQAEELMQKIFPGRRLI